MAYSRAEFRSSFGRIITVIIWCIMAAALWGVVVTGDAELILRNLWWPLLGAVVTWAIMWRPEVVIDRSRVDVVNPLSSWVVPWGAIQRIDTKWALELYTARGRITAFAAPAPSRYGTARINRDDIRLARESSLVGDAIRPGDSVHSVSGAAAHVTRTHWEELRDEGSLDDSATPARTWHWATIAAIAVTAIGAALGVLLP